MAVGFFALFDDIASLLDDIAVLTKAATKKTVGVLGDDLALNADQLTGISAKRELPVVWAVTKGSLLNKLILVPVALVLSYILPSIVHYLLMCGGAYLCYEGVEKVIHTLRHQPHADERRQRIMTDIETTDILAFEQRKIRNAIRTDFILSAEIIVIALGELVKHTLTLPLTIISLSLVALLITFFIYGVVAVIVKIDDVGKYWAERYSGLLHHIGLGLLWLAPQILKGLSIIGTIAMFLVGGHIWADGIPILHHLMEKIPTHGIISWIGNGLLNIIAGGIVGIIIYLPIALWHRLRTS